MSTKDSPELPYNFKFETPALGVEPIVYFQRELERIVEHFNDHLIQVREEIQRLKDAS